MFCGDCRFEFDEVNESQPVCPACGGLPTLCSDDLELSALLDESPVVEATADSEEADEIDVGVDDSIRLPADLQEAADDAEALLEATGLAIFLLPGGFRLFRLPTDRLM
ncbi:MAG: hypothetical protein LC130_23730 [Bryobacterales bacterium]|nr:hypothetical protein [Bryobacterales bacterium]